MKHTFPLFLAIAVLLGACGGNPTAVALPTAGPTTAPTQDTAPGELPEKDNANAGDEKTAQADGMTQVFIPTGSFFMGGEDPDAQVDEKPSHSIKISGFWMDKMEITNAMYELCVKAGACTPPRENKSASRTQYYGHADFANFPVIYVTHEDAVNYCAWAGRRLPTEAEWEYAARGSDSRLYPWGNDKADETFANFDYKLRDTQHVGAYPTGASAFGILDMSGNVWEWVTDYYDPGYYAKSPDTNPTGPEKYSVNGKRVVMRGGSWADPYKEVRATNRGFALAPDRDADKTSERYKGEAKETIGFRCAQSQ